jgi:hypothetical protein
MPSMICFETNAKYLDQGPRARERRIIMYGFKVLTVVAGKSMVCWVITPCRSEGWTYRLHLQDRKISQRTNQQEQAASLTPSSAGFVLRTTSRYSPEDHNFRIIIIWIYLRLQLAHVRISTVDWLSKAKMRSGYLSLNIVSCGLCLFVSLLLTTMPVTRTTALQCWMIEWY